MILHWVSGLCCLKSGSRIVHSYWDVTIADKGQQKLRSLLDAYCLVACFFLLCHFCSDIRPRFLCFHPKGNPSESPYTTDKAWDTENKYSKPGPHEMFYRTKEVYHWLIIFTLKQKAKVNLQKIIFILCVLWDRAFVWLPTFWTVDGIP